MAVILFNWVTQARQESKQAAAEYLQERDLIALRALKVARLKRVARDKRIWGVGVIVASALSAAVSSAITYNVVVARQDKSTAIAATKQAYTPRMATKTPTQITPQLPMTITAPTMAAVPAPPPLAPAAAASTVTTHTAIQLPSSQSPVTATMSNVGPVLPNKPIEVPRPQMAMISLPGKAQEPPQKTTGNGAFLTAPMRPAAVAVQQPGIRPTTATQTSGMSTQATPNSFVAFSSETPPQTPQNTPTPAQPPQLPPAQANGGFTVVGMPTDKVILIKLQGDETVRPVSVGQKLPNGEVLKLVNPSTAVATTDNRSIQLGKN